MAKLQRACLTDPVRVEVASKYKTVDTLRQEYLFIPAKHKVGLCACLLYVLSVSVDMWQACVHPRQA